MSLSDFILAVIVLIGIACVVWVFDLNPYSKQFQIYHQTCDNMILENTFCKGVWSDSPTMTFTVSEYSDQVIAHTENQTDSVTYDQCMIQDRKNWSCIDQTTQQEIKIKDGIMIYNEKNNIRQITRLEWLQNKFLKLIGN